MNNSDWLDIDVLEDYLDGNLDAKTMHRVERLSLEDPFVAEALAGLSESPKRTQSLSLLQKQLQHRIAQKPVVRKRWQITSQRLSIAAAAAVLFVTVSVLFWMREKGNRDQIVAGTPKKVEVTIEPTKQQPIVNEPASKKDAEVLSSKNIDTFSSSAVAVLPPKAARVKVAENKVAAKKEENSGAEVTIVAASRSMRPEPAGGWNKFQTYLIDNNKLLIDKKPAGRYITVSFELEKDGTPINISASPTLKSAAQLSEAEVQETIRLFKEGPKWVMPSPGSSGKTTVNIRF